MSETDEVIKVSKNTSITSKSKMVAGRHLGNFKSPSLRKGSSDLLRVWF